MLPRDGGHLAGGTLHIHKLRARGRAGAAGHTARTVAPAHACGIAFPDERSEEQYCRGGAHLALEDDHLVRARREVVKRDVR